MRGGELKDKVATGVAWSISEKIGSMLLQMAVSIIVARLLMPEDFGIMALLTFFTSLSSVIVDSGFSQTLIRKERPSATDYSSVFLFNLAISAVLYVLLVLAAPAVADFYGKPVIADIAPVLFLLLPLNALCVIQNTIYTRKFRFGLLSKITFASSLAGGITAVAMALAGCGIWSLVGQRLAIMALKALMLWLLSDWRPSARVSFAPVAAMAPFSFRLLATDMISALYNNIAQMFIGKIYSTDTLGYFNQAQKFKDLPVTSTMQSVQSVTYPALSKIGNDERKLAESYRQIIMITAFMMFPVMVGIIAVADDMFALLLGEKWMPTVPYLRILCLTGLFQPLAIISYNILKVKSDGRIILWLELLKKTIMTAILAATIPHSVAAVAWGLAAMSLIEFIVNFAAATRYSSLSALWATRTLLPVIVITALMYGAVVFVGSSLADMSIGLRLIIKIATGVVVYTLSAFIFRLEAAREIGTIVRKIFLKRQ